MKLKSRIKLFILCFSVIPSLSFGYGQTCKMDAPAETASLVDNNDGTISDPKTGLVWMKCTEGQVWNSNYNSCYYPGSLFTWQETFERAQSVNQGTSGNAFGVYTWRVPNIKELSSISESRCIDPAVNKDIFPLFVAVHLKYWSSTMYYASHTQRQAWFFNFNSGETEYLGNKGGKKYLRLVRTK